MSNQYIFTFDEVMRQILQAFPNGEVGEDDDGQLVIHTGLRVDENNRVVPFEDES